MHAGRIEVRFRLTFIYSWFKVRKPKAARTKGDRTGHVRRGLN